MIQWFKYWTVKKLLSSSKSFRLIFSRWIHCFCFESLSFSFQFPWRRTKKITLIHALFASQNWKCASRAHTSSSRCTSKNSRNFTHFHRLILFAIQIQCSSYQIIFRNVRARDIFNCHSFNELIKITLLWMFVIFIWLFTSVFQKRRINALPYHQFATEKNGSNAQ